MHKSAKEKVAPKTGNFPAQVSLNLNLEKQGLALAFQEEIKDMAHLLDKASILTINFLGFCPNPQTIRRS